MHAADLLGGIYSAALVGRGVSGEQPVEPGCPAMASKLIGSVGVPVSSSSHDTMPPISPLVDSGPLPFSGLPSNTTPAIAPPLQTVVLPDCCAPEAEEKMPGLYRHPSLFVGSPFKYRAHQPCASVSPLKPRRRRVLFAEDAEMVWPSYEAPPFGSAEWTLSLSEELDKVWGYVDLPRKDAGAAGRGSDGRTLSAIELAELAGASSEEWPCGHGMHSGAPHRPAGAPTGRPHPRFAAVVHC